MLGRRQDARPEVACRQRLDALGRGVDAVAERAVEPYHAAQLGEFHPTIVRPHGRARNGREARDGCRALLACYWYCT